MEPTAEKKYPVIKNDASIDIKVSGYYYKVVQGLLIKKSSTIPKEDFLKILKNFRDQKSPNSELEEEIHILSALVMTIEQAARAQNHIEWHDLDTLKSMMKDPT